MKIVDNRQIVKTAFRDINIGEIFQTVNGDFFLKCYREETDEYDYNCVNLKTGVIDYCTEFTECSPIKAALVVE